MKARNLRIGNFFYPDIFGAGKDDFEVITGKDIMELESDPLDDYYKPLLLSEEWMMKLGFKKISKGFNVYYKKIEGKHSDGRDNTLVKIHYFAESQERIECFAFMWSKYMESSPRKDVILKYVHQLQNLYFVLTGKELTVQLQKKA